MGKNASGKWINQRAAQIYGFEPGEYGLQVHIIARLAENGSEITKPTISNIFKAGLRPSVIANPELLDIWAETLKCTIDDILRAHGHNLQGNLGELIAKDEDAMRVVQLMEEAIQTGQKSALEAIRSVAETLVKPSLD